MNNMKKTINTINGMAQKKNKFVPEISFIAGGTPECEEGPHANIKVETFNLLNRLEHIPGKRWATQLLEQTYAEQIF